jgi:hypothetical protein
MKPLLFGTCYVADEAMRDLVIRWSLLNRKLNPGLDIMLIDSASPFDPRYFLPTKAPQHANIIVKRFDDNIGHLSRGGGDGWGRAFCRGIELAAYLGYSHIAYIDADMLFARPVMPILQKMERVGVKVACPMDCMYGFVENGIVFADLDYLRDVEFIRKYNWGASPPAASFDTLPERRFEKIVEDDLFTLPLRGLRNDQGDFTVANFQQHNVIPDYITHCADQRVYDAFLTEHGIKL